MSLTKADTAMVVGEWRRRIEAEYQSAALTQQVVLWLIQAGSPPDLIRDGLRIVDDELTHSELSAGVALAAGGDNDPPNVDVGRVLQLFSTGSVANCLTVAIVRIFCIGETVAVPLFKMLRENATVTTARKALDRILRDEARHRQFGWDVLDWLLSVGGTEVIQIADGCVAGSLRDVLAAYAWEGDLGGPGLGNLSVDAMAWGLAPPSAYAGAVAAALQHDVAPRLAARGVTVSLSI